jgi:NADP-dependent 3-hydroxy acid dehydrogenase YdfG
LETLAAGIRKEGGTALVLELDITDEKQANDAVASTAAELGRLDALVNNAGVMWMGYPACSLSPIQQTATAASKAAALATSNCSRSSPRVQSRARPAR